MKCLQRKLMLDWNCKHEFLNHITEQITTYTYYLSCHQVYDVAKAIIQKFPYLCEKIGSGYDGWYICIKDKLKNVRRKSDEPSATCRKKLKMSDKILTSVARKRSFPKASSNITKHLKEMEDAINDLEEQTPKAVAYERCVTAIMLIPEMLGEKSDGMIRVYDVSFKTI